MLIALDEVIPYGEEAFSRAGQVRLYGAAALTPKLLRGVDALIVRSVTRVHAGLLEGSSVRFIGTASIGVDHVDEQYLASRGIRFTNAAGSNANSVAEYVTATLLLLAERHRWDLASKSLAIIGAGNVGSRVEKKARALGMPVRLCDPPLRDATGDPRYLGFEETLDADILTFHVPLTKSGAYPTYHLVDRELLDRLDSRQVLLNSARGAVIDGAALKTSLKAGRIAAAALDVWENEPRIDRELLEVVDIGTAHIAGYSLDGKVRGTRMIFEELCRFFGIAAEWNTDSIFPRPATLRADTVGTVQDRVRSFVLRAYDILSDDRKLRAVSEMTADAAAGEFDRLRNSYVHRPEFSHFTAVLPPGTNALERTLRSLGFRISADACGEGKA